jgi:hypothetical protein
MAKRRRSSTELWDYIARLLVVMFLLAYAPVVAWWNSLPPFFRTFMLAMITIAIFAAVGAVIMFDIYRKRERAGAWRRAMTGWQNSTQGNAIAQRHSAIAMSAVELEQLAAQVYKKMGYKVQHIGETSDHGVDVMLINPKGQKEIVQCKEWNKQVGEPVIRDLLGAMTHEGAARGWLWAPRGFSEPAKAWAKGKTIELVNDQKIGQLIELAFGNKK